MKGNSWQDEWMDKIKQGSFFPISNALFKYRMKPVERCVYLYLVSVAGVSQKCYPSMQTIARHCGCCENTARKAVDFLEREGFISKTATYTTRRNGKNQQMNNLYYILDLPPLEGRGIPEESRIIMTAEELKAQSNEISEIYKSQLPETVTA